MDVSPDDRAARRTIVLLALGVVVVLLGAGLLAVAQRHRGGPGADIAADNVVGGRPADIGPAVNTTLSGYVETRRQALATAAGTRLAVASLARYVTADEARAAVEPIDVVALIVAGPGGAPAVVRGGLGNWIASQRAEAKADFEDVHTLVCSKTVDDADFTTFYDTEQQRLLALQSVDADQPLVFAVIVRAPAAQLRSLASAPGIRLVDVGGTGRFAAAAAYHGLRPEEVTIAGQPTPYRPFSGARPVPACPKR